MDRVLALMVDSFVQNVESIMKMQPPPGLIWRKQSAMSGRTGRHPG
jgi:hypothetical protein